MRNLQYGGFRTMWSPAGKGPFGISFVCITASVNFTGSYTEDDPQFNEDEGWILLVWLTLKRYRSSEFYRNDLVRLCGKTGQFGKDWISEGNEHEEKASKFRHWNLVPQTLSWVSTVHCRQLPFSSYHACRCIKFAHYCMWCGIYVLSKSLKFQM